MTQSGACDASSNVSLPTPDSSKQKEKIKIQNSAPNETLQQLSPSVHGKGCAMGELRLSKEEMESVNAFIQSAGFRFAPRIPLVENASPIESPPAEPLTPTQPPAKKLRSKGNAVVTTDTKEEAQPDQVAARPKRAVRTRKLTTTVAAAEPLAPTPGGYSKRRRTATPQSQTKTKILESQPVEEPTPLPSSNNQPAPIKGEPILSATPKKASGPKVETGIIVEDSVELPREQEKVADSSVQVKAPVVASESDSRPPPPLPQASPPPPPPPPPKVVLTTNVSLYTTSVAALICPQRKKSHFVIHSADQSWESACARLMSILDSSSESKWFARPVDPESQGLQDYYEKIKTPMDLQTVRQKLEGGMYSHPFRWQHDMRTIFLNAFLYHSSDSAIWKSAAELAVTFENLCKDIVEVNPYAVFMRPAASAARPAAVAIATVDKSEPVGTNSALSNTSSAPIASATSDHQKAQGTNETSSMPIPPVPPAPRKSQSHSLRSKKVTPYGVKIKEPGNVITYTADCGGTDLARYYEVHLPGSALPQPRLTQGPGFEAGSSAAANQARSGGVSNSQKKNLPARFRELDVFYRKALLDWVKDELGIHALLCALDVRYVPDLDLLPPVKAKQFFVHMKSLMAQQKQAQDEQYLPTTLPRVLNWDVPGLKAASSLANNSASSVTGTSSTGVRFGAPSGMSQIGMTQSPPPISPSSTGQIITTASQHLRPPQKSSWAVPNRNAGASEDESEESEESETDSSDDSSDESDEAQANEQARKPLIPVQQTPALGGAMWNKPVGWGGGLGKQRVLPPFGGGLGLWRQSSFANNAAAAPATMTEPPSSCWGEWKARAMQHDSQVKAKARDVSAATESEARAERADAEI